MGGRGFYFPSPIVACGPPFDTITVLYRRVAIVNCVPFFQVDNSDGDDDDLRANVARTSPLLSAEVALHHSHLNSQNDLRSGGFVMSISTTSSNKRVSDMYSGIPSSRRLE